VLLLLVLVLVLVLVLENSCTRPRTEEEDALRV